MTSNLRRFLPLLVGGALLIGAGAPPAGGIVPGPDLPLPDIHTPNPYPLGACVKPPRVSEYTCIIIDPRDPRDLADGAVPA